MTEAQTKYGLVLTAAVAGVVLVCAGLWLASLSHPGRFSLDIRADRQIHVFAAAGFACTIVGVGLLLTAVGHTTKSMPPQNRTNTNIGVGFGFLLQLLGVFLFGTGPDRGLIACMLILASLPVFIWGCLNYAEGKGHSKWVGLVGVVGIAGLVVLMVLPHQPRVAK